MKTPKQIRLAGKIYDLVPDKIKVKGKVYTRVEAIRDDSLIPPPITTSPVPPKARMFYLSLPGDIQLLVRAASSGQAAMKIRRLIKSSPDTKSFKPSMVIPSDASRIQKLIDRMKDIEPESYETP